MIPPGADVASGATARLRLARRLALACAVGAVLVVGVSAFMRLGAAGLGCADWPGCYGKVLQYSAVPHDPWLRGLHRVVASATLLLAIALGWLCRGSSGPAPLRRRVNMLVGLMLVLALVGPASANPANAMATFINILGGIGVVVLAWKAFLATWQAPRHHHHPLLSLGRGLLALTLCMGALIAARYAALACAGLPFCGEVAWPAGDGLYLFSPVTAVVPPGDSGGVAAHLMHRYAACGVVLVLGLALWRTPEGPARRGIAVAFALACGVVALGGMMLFSGFALPWAVAHALGAALLAAALATAGVAPRRSK